MGTPGGEPGAISARGLSFRHRENGNRNSGTWKGIASLDLAVTPGEVIGVLGPNGSGKSTLLRLLSTDLRPDRGVLVLLGLPAVPPRPGLRRRIAFAPDATHHLAALTGRENLAFFRALRRRGQGGAAEDARRLFEDLALGPDSDRRVSGYSFGMRRKLLLAQTLTSGADLLLLDEPAVGLDPPALEAVREAIRDRSHRGAAVIVATNELRDVPFWADRIHFLDRGREVASGSPSALINRCEKRTRLCVTLGNSVAGPSGPGTAVAGTATGVDWAPHLPKLRQVPGIRSVRGERDHLEAESSARGAPLPSLLALLLEAGLEVRDVQVREPGLAEVFEELTGRAMRRDDGAHGIERYRTVKEIRRADGAPS